MLLYVYCCCIPRCPETMRKGVLCARHLALVPPGLKLRLKAGRRRSLEGSMSKYTAEVCAIKEVLLELWTLAFPVPPQHVSRMPEYLVCTCPLCTEAGFTAARAREGRRTIRQRFAA